MARARSSGPAAYISGLVFLGFGFLLFLFLFIYNFAHVEDARNKKKEAEAALSQFVSGQERNHPQVVDALADKQGGTVVGSLLAESGRLKQLVAGNEEMLLADVEAAVDRLAGRGALVSRVQDLQGTHEADERSIAQAQADAERARGLYAGAEKEKIELAETYRHAVTKLKGELTGVSQAFAEFRDRFDGHGADLTRQFTDLRDEHQQKVIELESLLDQKEQVIVGKNARIDELMDKLKQEKGSPVVDGGMLADGRIADVQSRQGLVYINRGKADHILPGMTFEVYSSTTGPTKNQFGEYQGKATIEVVNVLANTSVARIVRQPDRGRDVIEGDMIANLIYDPDMVFKFFVYGDFDIDRDGRATDTDRRRVEMMIVEWGGDLASSRESGGDPKPISYDVDFLVLGAEPLLPQAPSRDEIDPEKERIYIQAKKRYETYHGLVMEAKELAIPILNQNRFLVQTGYYER